MRQGTERESSSAHEGAMEDSDGVCGRVHVPEHTDTMTTRHLHEEGRVVIAWAWPSRQRLVGTWGKLQAKYCSSLRVAAKKQTGLSKAATM